MLWLFAIRQQPNTYSSAVPQLCHYMASLGLNELKPAALRFLRLGKNVWYDRKDQKIDLYMTFHILK